MKSDPSAKEIIRSMYDLYSNDVYRFAWSHLGDASEAHDVVQEVFLRAYRSLNHYRHDASAKTWLMTIARNYIFDFLRKKKTERKHLAEADIPDAVDTQLPVELLMEVEAALGQLSDEYREVVVLRHIENLSVQHTAKILGWSEKKVHNTTHRAIMKLREIFGSNSEEVKMNHGV
jgi:RNA polymerase sigma-70 factor, ECF subfamily